MWNWSESNETVSGVKKLRVRQLRRDSLSRKPLADAHKTKLMTTLEIVGQEKNLRSRLGADLITSAFTASALRSRKGSYLIRQLRLRKILPTEYGFPG
jgi:hypothetical protein